uniref:Uncharacterized protein n=1 Tax=Rhizophora mucronata TaxID=61149 RepID=A0A2P2MYN3_RHIMU
MTNSKPKLSQAIQHASMRYMQSKLLLRIVQDVHDLRRMPTPP